MKAARAHRIMAGAAKADATHHRVSRAIPAPCGGRQRRL
jgi:hypothetical protein